MNLEMLRGLEYEPQDAESEVLLSDLPLDIITGSIETQFNDPMEYRKNDFVQSFITKYQVTKENIEDEDEAEELQEVYDKFISFMENIFHEKLGLGLPELDDMGEDDQLELIHYIYRFFIINIKKNFTIYILNYIEEHKEDLAASLPKKKDVSTSSLKQAVTDPDDLTIVVSIAEAIHMILSDEDVTVEKFLEGSRGEDANLENEYISEAYDEFKINGNFVMNYFKMATEDFRVEVECKVRNKILKKYRKK